MKLISVIAIISFLLVKAAFAQVLFQRSYGGGQINDARHVMQTSDHGYAVTGSVTPLTGGLSQIYLLKTDSMGIPVFQEAYGGSNIDQGRAVVQLADSGFVIGGFTNSFSANNDYQGCLLRTDKNGVQMWLKTYGGSDWDFIEDIDVLPSGNILCTGNTFGSGNGISSGWLFETDTDGNVIWEKFHQHPSPMELMSGFVNADGSLSVVGKLTPSSGTESGWFMHLNSSGDTLSTLRYSESRHVVLNDVKQFQSGDFLLAGSVEDVNSGETEELMIRVDQGMNIVWTEVSFHGGININTSACIRNDTIFAVGYTNFDGTGGTDFHIAAFDSLKIYLSGNTYGGAQDEVCHHAEMTSDGGFIFTGTTRTYGPSFQSVFLVKTNASFTTPPAVIVGMPDASAINSSPQFYPNPANGILNFKNVIDGSLKAFDLSGRLVGTMTIAGGKADISRLSAGVYVVSTDDERSRNLLIVY